MIQDILQLLKHANGETENIRLAKGKNELPKSLRGAFIKFKKERKWQ